MCIHIRCPQTGENQKNRIDELFQSISHWIYATELQNLIRIFAGEIPKSCSLKEYIRWLNKFVDIWDFRKTQANGGERWNIVNTSAVDKNAKEIMSAAHSLGMMDVYLPQKKPNYVLPLGGARMTNWSRPQMARRLADQMKLEQISVVALSGNRPLNEVEKQYTEVYAPKAKTEYDAINKGIESAFDTGEAFEEERIWHENINLQSAVRKYKKTYRDCRIYSLMAPSSDALRRANSIDTFRFFVNYFSVGEKDRILLITSCIYVPFQIMKFMELAIENNLEVDCVGVSPDLAGNVTVNPANYLQEMKSMINAIYLLSEKYL